MENNNDWFDGNAPCIQCDGEVEVRVETAEYRCKDCGLEGTYGEYLKKGVVPPEGGIGV